MSEQVATSAIVCSASRAASPNSEAYRAPAVEGEVSVSPSSAEGCEAGTMGTHLDPEPPHGRLDGWSQTGEVRSGVAQHAAS